MCLTSHVNPSIEWKSRAKPSRVTNSTVCTTWSAKDVQLAGERVDGLGLQFFFWSRTCLGVINGMARHLLASDALIDLLFSTNYFVCRYPPLLPASSRPFSYSELAVHNAVQDGTGLEERKEK